MKKKKFKKLITLLVLAVLFSGLITGAVLLKKFNAKEEAPPEEDTSVTAFDKGSTIITKLFFKSEEEEMSFTYVNDDWVYDKDGNFPLNQDRVASMAAAVGKVVATLKVENVSEKLSDYGLDAPILTVNATFSDNTEKTFLFGDENDFNSCQYFKIDGEDSIYMVETSVADNFAVDLDYLYEAESYQLQKDSVTDSDVSSITIMTEGGQEKVISDEEGIFDLYELLYTLDLSEYEDYYADENEMKYEYGISKEGERITVSYTLETTDSSGNTQKLPKEYTVYIGYKFENAEEETDSESTDTTAAEEEKEHSYFYSFEGSTVVYSADGETVDEIFGFLAYEPSTEETTAAES